MDLLEFIRNDRKGNLYITKSDFHELDKDKRLELELFLNESNIQIKDIVIEDDKVFLIKNYGYKNDFECENIQEDIYKKLLLYKKIKDINIREEVVLYNIQLVTYISFKYASFYGIDINELRSYGYEGLLIAIEKYNPTLGYSFFTFVLKYLDYYMKIGCRKILFGYRNDLSNYYINFKRNFENINNSKLVENPKLIDEMIELLECCRDIRIKNKQLIKRRVCLLNSISLGDIESLMIEDDESILQFEEILSKIDCEILKRKLESILALFPFREQLIIKLRFGLIDGKIYTLEQVGKELSLSRERIRAIESTTLKKLKHPSFGLLKYYIDDVKDSNLVTERGEKSELSRIFRKKTKKGC